MHSEPYAHQAPTTGMPQSGETWLSDHFVAAQSTYEHFVRLAAFRTGAQLLDAGCGAGDFLPALRQAVGPSGRLVAVDLDHTNVAAIGDRGQAIAAVSSVLALPFEDDAFDGVWSANVTEYLDDADLARFLAELRRVTRISGVVAIKDVDVSALTISIGDPLLAARLADACARQAPVAVESRGSIRGRALGRWLMRGGYQSVRQHVAPIEYSAPLGPAAERLWSSWLMYLAALASVHDLESDDSAVWASVASPDGARRAVTSHDFYACELQVLATGCVPAG